MVPLYLLFIAENRKVIQETIDEAWATSDQEARAFQDKLFPEGKPGPWRFVWRTSCLVWRETMS